MPLLYFIHNNNVEHTRNKYVQYSTLQYSRVQYSRVQYSTVQYGQHVRQAGHTQWQTALTIPDHHDYHLEVMMTPPPKHMRQERITVSRGLASLSSLLSQPALIFLICT